MKNVSRGSDYFRVWAMGIKGVIAATNGTLGRAIGIGRYLHSNIGCQISDI